MSLSAMQRRLASHFDDRNKQNQMLNILPTTEKKKILTEYRLRLASMAFFAVAALILVSLVLLVPSYILAVTKFNSISSQITLQESKQDLTGQGKVIDVQVREVNKKINLFLLGRGVYRLSPPDIIAKIIAMRGSTIKIQGFDYDAAGGQERLAISGVAADRDSLAQFVDVLKKDPTFTSIELPVSSYVKSTNISFSIMATRVQAPQK